jgi:hypothetical protein
MQVTFDSAADLAEARRRLAADWYAQYMEQEQAGRFGQAGPGARP